jgi:hypothetical protein
MAVRPSDLSGIADKTVQLKVANFLVRQQFDVSMSKDIDEGQPMLRATTGLCRMLVAKSSATGADRDVIRKLATGSDDVFVIFDGRIYDQQPVFLTALDSLWARLRRELGFTVNGSLLLSVVASTSCQAERLPWREVGS